MKRGGRWCGKISNRFVQLGLLEPLRAGRREHIIAIILVTVVQRITAKADRGRLYWRRHQQWNAFVNIVFEERSGGRLTKEKNY